MIDFKKLHGDFLMHQALLTAAVVVNNPIQHVSPAPNSTAEDSNERKHHLENSTFNDTSYDCPSSLSSLCSNSPNDLSPSSVNFEDKSCKNRENSSNDEVYQVISKKIKTEHRENLCNQENEQKANQGEKSKEDLCTTEPQQPAENSAASPLTITVHSTPGAKNNFSPIGSISNGLNNNKRKLSDYEPLILNDSSIHCKSDGNKSLKSNLLNKQESCQRSSPLSSLSSSSPLSKNSSRCSPPSYTPNISNPKMNKSNTKPSFMISDILGLENKNIPAVPTTQLESGTQISNEHLFQQCQIQLMRAFPYLTNLTNNQSDLFRLIASSMIIEPQNKYLNTTYAPTLSPDTTNNMLSKSYNNHLAVSSTPILTSPKSNTPKNSNVINNTACSPISYQINSTSNAVNVQNSKQVNINNLEKKVSPPPTANLILSSLEQLTYNQFKDFSSSSRKNINDTNSSLSLSKKLASCTPTGTVSQLSPISSLSSLSSSSSSASSLASLSSSLLSLKNSSKTIDSRSCSTEQINRKALSKNEVLESSSTSNINKSANEQNGNLWPAWVYCTRYSDRPSAGPRHRKKSKKVPSSLNTSASSNSNKGSNSTETNSSITNESSRQLSNKYEQSILTKGFKHDDANYGNKKSAEMAYLSPYTNSFSNNSTFANSLNIDKNATSIKAAYGNNYLNHSKYSNNNEVDIRADDESTSSMVFCNENEYIEEDSRPPSEENNYYDKSPIKSDLNDRDITDTNNNQNLDDDDEYFSDNDSDNSHSKRPRTAFTGSQLNRLKHEFEKCKYLTGEKRQFLANELKLNESQIKIWFQNKRAKIKKSSGVKNTLALQLMAQGLYNHGSNKNDEDNYSD